jgi:hypothetical protein
MNNTLPCIVCGRELESANGDDPRFAHINQPQVGTTFYAEGQYGSTIFDPMDGSYLEVNICDACLAEHQDRINVGRSTRPVFLEYCGIVGYQKIEHESQPWNPAEPHPFKSRCNLKLSELENLPDDVHLRFSTPEQIDSLRQGAEQLKNEGRARWGASRSQSENDDD